MGSALQTFFSRLRSTIVLWLVCGGAMFWGHEAGFWILISVLLLGALREFYQMLHEARLPHHSRIGLFLGAVLVLGSLFIGHRAGSDTALAFECAMVAVSMLCIFGCQIAHKEADQLPVASISYTLLGLVYIPFLGSFAGNLIYLTPRGVDGQLTGHFYLLYLAVVTKFSDCGAYLLGSLIGKHLMIPRISPKKTWEGFAGALLLSVFGSVSLLKLFPEQLSLIPSLWHGVVLGLVLGLVAVIGDLAESVLKRSTGTKDSGHSLPGIGGAMDLVDSLLFTAPLLHLYLRYAAAW